MSHALQDRWVAGLHTELFFGPSYAHFFFFEISVRVRSTMQQAG